ncbi:MAG TPA: hypothetical protein VHN11_04815 [Xanthobacteraceae bacterium]|jgi:hypothetical protein|nr:hypothetical protein [Xanthobacteraceae bacterium]
MTATLNDQQKVCSRIATEDMFDAAQPLTRTTELDLQAIWQAMFDAAPSQHAALGAQGEPVAWQVRRTDGRIDGVPILWESCTKQLYDATLATGRYAGYENGPRCEVRALCTASVPRASDAEAAAAHRPSDDDLWDQTLQERDSYHEWADKLAAAIAEHFGIDIGEHSSANNPWSVALDTLESMPATAAHAESIPHGWKPVPVEPTQEMLDALWDSLPNGFGFSNCTPAGVIRSIIAAAPAPAATAPAALTDEQKKHIAQIVHTDCTLISGATFYNAAEMAIDATLARLTLLATNPSTEPKATGEAQ